MRKTVAITLIAVYGIMLLPRPAKADFFGFDIGPLIQLVNQGIAAARQADAAYQQMHRFANFVEHPGSVRNAISTATMDASAAIHQVSNGSDNEALARLDQTISASRTAIQEAMSVSDNMNAESAATLSQLVLQQADAVNQRDQLYRHLQDQRRVDGLNDEGIGDLGNVSETIKGRILK